MLATASGKQIFRATGWARKGTLSVSAQLMPTSFPGYFGEMPFILHCCTRTHAISARAKAPLNTEVCTPLPQRSGPSTTTEHGGPTTRTYWETLLPAVFQTSTILPRTEAWD